MVALVGGCRSVVGGQFLGDMLYMTYIVLI